MNVFYEFYKILQHLQQEDVEYALIGGVAMAFYSTPRYTKDIDLLIKEPALPAITGIMAREGYLESAQPWTFRESRLTLHRFMKVQDGDDMVVDVLVAGTDRHLAIIDNALQAESEGMGTLRVARKDDLMWPKSARNSKQDQADIARLLGEEG